MLETIDLSARLDKETFAREKEALHNAVRRAQLLAWKHHLGVLVVLEGWSFSGRVTAARFLAESMDPRGMKTHVYYPPSEEEKRYPFHRRYWERLPPRGDVLVLVRSWYYHLMEDQVQRRDPPLGAPAVIEEVREFEQMLAQDGYLIVKFFLHVDGKTQRRRVRKFSKPSALLARSVPDDPRQAERRKRYRQAIETMLAGTDTDAGRWHLVSGTDDRHLCKTVATTLARRVEEEAARLDARPQADASVTIPALTESCILRSLDMSLRLEDEEYSDRLRKAQAKLSELLYDCVDQKRAVLLVFEGCDAAGKGGVIRRLTTELDPRYYDVHPIAAPKGEEKERHYLWRFWHRVPPAGHWAIFDRSWYGRVLVERVEGFATDAEWRRAYDELRRFEQALYEHGAILLKFWLQVTPDEQLRRFQERQDVEYKHYKITDEDWRNREKWPLYEVAVEEMLQRTSTPFAPWVTVPANDKNHARVTVLERVLAHVEEGLSRKRSRLRRF